MLNSVEGDVVVSILGRCAGGQCFWLSRCCMPSLPRLSVSLLSSCGRGTPSLTMTCTSTGAIQFLTTFVMRLMTDDGDALTLTIPRVIIYTATRTSIDSSG